MSHAPSTQMVVVNPQMPAEVEKAIASLPAELQPTCKKLREVVSREIGQNLKNAYEMGKLVREGCQQIEDKKQRQKVNASYGEHAIERWAEALHIGPRSLYQCLHVATAYSLEQCQKRIQEEGFTWSHLVELSGLPQPDREEFEDRVRNERLSVNELLDAIRDQYDKTPRGPGRRPNMPRNVNHALDKLSKSAGQYANLSQHAVFGEDFDLYGKINDVCPDDWTEENRDKVAETASGLEKLSEMAKEDADCLRELLVRIDRILASRKAKADTPSDDDCDAPVACDTTDEALDEQALKDRISKARRRRSTESTAG